MIWYIEEEIYWANGQAAVWYAEADADVTTGWWAQTYGAESTGSVGVMNLYAEGHVGDPAYSRQDQLIVTAIPAPAAAMLVAVGMLAFVAIRRRRSA